MNSRARQQRLLDYLNDHPIATVSQLVSHLACSAATVRRDISELDQEGRLKKIRNGAEKVLSPTTNEAPGMKGFYPHISDYRNFEECDRIAKKAVDICQDRDNIFIGEGKTTFLMGKYLINRNIHIYSNHLPLINFLVSQDFPHLVVLGGQYVKSQNLLVSADTDANYQGHYLFVSGDGLTDAGLTKSALLPFMEEKKMLQYVDKVIALVSTEKLGVFGGMSLFGLDELDIVITGKSADPAMIELLHKQHVAVFQV